MCLLYEAAMAWNQLSDTSYTIHIGHKGKEEILHIVFRAVDFDHLVGMQYAKDVDFKLHRSEYRGNNLVSAVLNGKIDPKTIEKSQNWLDQISYRVSGILIIPSLLEADLEIFSFNPNKLNFHSKLDASYLLYDGKTNTGFFLFLDEANDEYYCKSIFYDIERDYRKNQTKWKVLKKTKTVNGMEKELFTALSYKEIKPAIPSGSF